MGDQDTVVSPQHQPLHKKYEVHWRCTIWVIGIQNIVMLECTWKTCCLITTINQGSKVTSEKLSVLFCSAWSLLLYCKILNENTQIKEWQSVEVPTAKLQKFFGSILLKNIKISNAHNFRNTGPIKKISTLLSSEAWDLSPYKISWKSSFCWITWHGMTQNLCQWEMGVQIHSALMTAWQ